jgi:transcriptional regulator of acetoin/glycerol metabolism
MQALLDYPWPGNVRELDHAVERAVLMACDDVIRIDDLALRSGRTTAAHFERMSLDQAEVFLIKRALARCGGNVRQAARGLGLSRSGLYRRMEKYGLTHDG